MTDASRANSNLRKCYVSRGDDATLTRFVKIRDPIEQPDFFDGRRQRGNKGRVYGSAAIREGRPIFTTLHDPAEHNTLVSGHCNVKIGRDVRTGGLFDGYHIFTVSLPERLTCPSSCIHWIDCYGNHMPYAKRLDPGDPNGLMEALRRDVVREIKKRGRIGALVRLHALGDFFSVRYARFWLLMLHQYPSLACYGYTARKPDSEIGRVIVDGKERFGRRFAIRWSDGGLNRDCTVSIVHRGARPAGAFQCPEQIKAFRKKMNPKTGKPYPMLCATCGLCWSTDTNVAFLDH